MIPRTEITHWSAGAPWPSELQVEQDLVLSRLIVEIANHEFLGSELAFRGGTCLHKLHLPTALRYSEDLDYVRTTQGPVGPIVDALRDLTTTVGLEERSRKIRAGMATYVCRGPAETGGVIQIKIETNVEETEPFLDRVHLPYAVASPWYEGEAEVSTFQLDELMATKLRAFTSAARGATSSTSGTSWSRSTPTTTGSSRASSTTCQTTPSPSPSSRRTCVPSSRPTTSRPISTHSSRHARRTTHSTKPPTSSWNASAGVCATLLTPTTSAAAPGDIEPLRTTQRSNLAGDLVCVLDRLASISLMPDAEGADRRTTALASEAVATRRRLMAL